MYHLTVQAADQGTPSLTATATVTVTVSAANVPPTAVADIAMRVQLFRTMLAACERKDVDTLRARPQVALALLTGNLERGAEIKLSYYGVWGYFEFGAYADDHCDRNRLGPFAQARAKERLGVEFPPERIFVLGDTPHDITCGRAIGAKTVAIATGGYTHEQLAAHQPDFLFDDLSDVSGVLAALGV